jgi:hypothetical protein
VGFDGTGVKKKGLHTTNLSPLLQLEGGSGVAIMYYLKCQLMNKKK